MHLKKSRDIPASDYYSKLNIEYLCYYVRFKTYKREEDIKKFKDICRGKRETIDTISRKECKPSIFSCPNYKAKYISKIINEWGLPNFDYRDEYQRTVKGHWDKVYWLMKGDKVKVKTGDETFVEGIVKYFDYKENYITVVVDDEDKSYQVKNHVDNISKILKEDFFENFI